MIMAVDDRYILTQQSTLFTGQSAIKMDGIPIFSKWPCLITRGKGEIIHHPESG
jgi:hypothetical protein